jgi:hypothetical protein
VGRYHPLIALVACVACNAVFDIAPTLPPDGDGDGAPDGADNCAVVANPEQTDTDGDAIGDPCDPCDGPQSGSDRDGDGIDDLCDACPDGSNHDEDGDGVLDGCDVCPADVDDQADDDGDGIGNACDAAPGVINRRVFFDGFGPPRSGWRTWFNSWEARGDAYAPVSGGDYTGAWNDTGRVAGTDWWMELAVRTPPPSGYNYVGLFVRARPGGNQETECLVEFLSGQWHPNYDTSVPYTPGPILRFRYHASPAGAVCTIDGTPVFTNPVTAGPHVAALATADGTEFLWIDVVAGP